MKILDLLMYTILNHQIMNKMTIGNNLMISNPIVQLNTILQHILMNIDQKLINKIISNPTIKKRLNNKNLQNRRISVLMKCIEQRNTKHKEFL